MKPPAKPRIRGVPADMQEVRRPKAPIPEPPADGLLRRLADSTWTVPILVIVCGLILVAFALK